jgi:hypothetical protein
VELKKLSLHVENSSICEDKIKRTTGEALKRMEKWKDRKVRGYKIF